MTRTTPPSVAGMILSPAERARALAASLLDGPDLTGAACKGRAPLFDEQGPHEPPETYEARLHDAQDLCRSCPVLDRCHAAAEGMDAHLRAGVWAGAPYEHSETRRQRRSAERRAELTAAAPEPEPP